MSYLPRHWPFYWTMKSIVYIVYKESYKNGIYCLGRIWAAFQDTDHFIEQWREGPGTFSNTLSIEKTFHIKSSPWNPRDTSGFRKWESRWLIGVLPTLRFCDWWYFMICDKLEELYQENSTNPGVAWNVPNLLTHFQTLIWNIDTKNGQRMAGLQQNCGVGKVCEAQKSAPGRLSFISKENMA